MARDLKTRTECHRANLVGYPCYSRPRSILVVDRGVCTFASKGLRAQAAGALAVVVVQTFDVWPYMMEDTRGEAKAGDGLRIPMCMVSQADGECRYNPYSRKSFSKMPQSWVSGWLTNRSRFEAFLAMARTTTV